MPWPFGSSSNDEEDTTSSSDNEEEVRRQNQIGDFVAGQLGDDPTMSDSEWERLYGEGTKYYQDHDLPNQN